MYIDFSFVKTGEEFELLCEDLLRALSFTIESKASRGPDRGKDIIATSATLDAAGINETHRYLVECKHFAVSGKSVREADIGSPIARMGTHNCDRYILITSTVPSEKVSNQISGISNTVPSYKAIIWSSSDLRRFLDQHRDVRDRYFRPLLKMQPDKDLAFQVAERLKKYLSQPGYFHEIHRLLCQNPQLLPIEQYMFFAYDFRTKINVPEGGSVDCIAVRPDTEGIKGYVYYFGSPYENPFDEQGTPSVTTSRLFEMVLKHAVLMCKPLDRGHVLHPSVIMGDDSAGMIEAYHHGRSLRGLGPYGFIKIYIVAGQRVHHLPEQNALQTLAIAKLYDKFMRLGLLRGLGNKTMIEMLSYSRLLPNN